MSGGHQLYETGDPGVPDCITDGHGEVVLGLCKICGKGEIELITPCLDGLSFPEFDQPNRARKAAGVEWRNDKPTKVLLYIITQTDHEWLVAKERHMGLSNGAFWMAKSQVLMSPINHECGCLRPLAEFYLPQWLLEYHNSTLNPKERADAE